MTAPAQRTLRNTPKSSDCAASIAVRFFDGFDSCGLFLQEEYKLLQMAGESRYQVKPEERINVRARNPQDL